MKRPWILPLFIFPFLTIACTNSLSVSPIPVNQGTGTPTLTPLYTPISTIPYSGPTATPTPTGTSTSTVTHPLGSSTPTPILTQVNTSLSGSPTLTPTPTYSSTWVPTYLSGTPTFTWTPAPPSPVPTNTPIPCFTYTVLSTSILYRNHCPTVSFFKNKMWVLPGFFNQNDTWSSPDGAHWTQEATSTNLGNNFNYSTVEFNNELWAVGGNLSFSGPVPAASWATADGVNWTQTATLTGVGGRENVSLLSYNSQMWLIAGDTCVFDSNGAYRIQTNDVWNTPDGVNWNQATAHAPFGPRSGNGCVIFNNKMWVIAGASIVSCPSYNFTQYYNDAWCSTDGVNWAAATTSAPFAPRTMALVTVLNNQLWVIGGYPAGSFSNPLNDAWYSSDGAHWTQASGICPDFFQYSSRWNFQNQLWGMGLFSNPSLGYCMQFFHL